MSYYILLIYQYYYDYLLPFLNPYPEPRTEDPVPIITSPYPPSKGEPHTQYPEPRTEDPVPRTFISPGKAIIR